MACAVEIIVLTVVANTRLAALGRSTASHPKPHRIPRSIPRQTPALRRIAEITEFLQRRSRWDLAFIPRRRAASAPFATKRKPRRMWTSAILKFLDWHKKRAGHSLCPQ